MSELPKLRIKWLTQPFREKDVEFEKARSSLPFDSPYTTSITLEGQVIKSYDELVQLASDERYRGKPFLEVVVIAPVGGG